ALGTPTGDVPTATATTSTAAPTTQQTGAQLISVTTDKYDIRINPVGGDVVYAALREQTQTLDSKQPFVLLEEDSNRVYVAQSGLIGANGIDNS
ncbi:membrane protein insertase YidC, partial [Mycobacterium tuberculosis]|nr:membrane protein insertase YidC [Mycobacterium tuberculosis]